ncbi:MAG: hypothetical protein ACFE0Q_14670 [Anaerolineae bacterium]
MTHDLTPHAPKTRLLGWSENMLDLQDRLSGLALSQPLYLIGGAVRDAFLHLPIKDMDLAVPDDAVAIARQIANAFNGDVFVMDEERQVARVLLTIADQPLTVDVAKFRGDDLLADLLGRDFTVNAMAVDLLTDPELLIDPLNGEADATQKVIRRCAPNAIADDPIRALRAVRQSTQLQFRIEPQTIADIHLYGSELIKTSPERIRDEFFTILSLGRAHVALKVLHTLGLLQLIVPPIQELESMSLPTPHVFGAWKQAIETVQQLHGIIETISYRRNDSTAATFAFGMLAMQLDRFRQPLNDHLAKTHANGRPHTTLLILAGLLHRIPDAVIVAGQIADGLRLSKPEKNVLMTMIAHYQQAQTLDYRSPLSVHRFWHALKEGGLDAILLGLADDLATYGPQLNQDWWLSQVERALMLCVVYYEQQETVVNPPLLLDGNDLMAELSLQGGRIIGELLTLLREAQVVGIVKNHEQALALAQQYLDQHDAV